MDLGLNGRTALVTGGSKGIGLATGRCLAAEGVDVTLVARSADVLAAAAASIAGPGKVTTVAADLADEAERQRVVETVGDVDILVNNAGGIPGGNLLEFDDARWKAVWELKVFGYVSMCRQYYARMKAQGGGVIINIIGNAAEALDFDYICGSTANAGLCAFTRTLGSVSSRDGIRAVAINPGPVETDRLKTLMQKKAADRTGSADNWESLKEPLPFSRAASPEEIASMVAMLASDRSAYTSGTVVTIDGGIASQSRTF
ncbi:short-chain dehydrogenase [Acuticoccus sediminis]|uniref:Short-chain dehydrogenase n=1 Tax=Acuticoccus sediminis TaxID=2184697 RepID=A0A8B2P6R2_9HYPH|nr:short-chain dehydrogenase/reductase [Acuticoccus sediminis]RAI04269.1 short-chain dehydrogenase [Acuticoccus sediminis]